jgi:hypothetical protein
MQGPRLILSKITSLEKVKWSNECMKYWKESGLSTS